MMNTKQTSCPLEKCRRIFAWFFIFLPVLINKWTVEYLLSGHVGAGLSDHNNLFLHLILISFAVMAICSLKHKKIAWLEILIVLQLFLPIFLLLIFACFINGIPNAIADIAYGQMLGMIIYSLLILAFGRWGLYSSFLLQTVICFIEFFHIVNYSSFLTISSFITIFETNFLETQGYLDCYLFTLTNLLFLLVHIVLFIVLYRTACKANIKKVAWYAIVLAIMLVSPIGMKSYRKQVLCRCPIISPILAWNEYQVAYEQNHLFAAKDLDDIEEVIISTPVEAELHVLIIGESADPDHMGIYGYERNTTPIMATIEDNLYCFSDVISPHHITIPTIKKILTFANYESEDNYYEKGSLIHYLQKAGYRTYWISSQKPVGISDTMTTVVAKSCDIVVFINVVKDRDHLLYDEELTPVLKKIIDEKQGGKRKFVIVHLMGSHLPYKQRYPAGYEVFTGQISDRGMRESSIINEYDNSIVYTDDVVTQMIGIMDESNIYSSLLYISDHGLDVYDKSGRHGHSYSGGLEIPFILWLSDEYKAANSTKISNWHNYLDRKYLNDDLIYSICDLLNMQFSSMDLQRSIFSDKFKPKKRFVGSTSEKKGRDYDIGIVDKLAKNTKTMRERTKAFQEKVWVHAVNSIQKLRGSCRLFKGVECDVVFNRYQKIFDVRHPPAKSIDLTLDEYWSVIDEPGNYKYWIDFKNLASDNKKISLQRLMDLAEKYHIARENIMIESKIPGPLVDFKKAGFSISYWVSMGRLRNDVDKHIDKLSDEGYELLTKFKREIKRYEIDTISFPIESLAAAEKFFPEVKSFNLWDNSRDFDNQEDLLFVENVLSKHPRLQSFLMEFSHESL